MKILNLTCKRTNSYLLEANCGWLMIDTDFPDTLHQLMKLLKQQDIKVGDIKYLIVTHFHPDHAGIVQELKNLGIRLIILEGQLSFIDKLNDFFKNNPKFNYTDITSEANVIIHNNEGKKFLKSIGINGDIIQTPGHTDDSITLIIDGECAFTGDLPEFALIEAYNDEVIKDSWKSIKDHKVTKIYPAHGKPYTII